MTVLLRFIRVFFLDFQEGLGNLKRTCLFTPSCCPLLLEIRVAVNTNAIYDYSYTHTKVFVFQLYKILTTFIHLLQTDCFVSGPSAGMKTKLSWWGLGPLRTSLFSCSRKPEERYKIHEKAGCCSAGRWLTNSVSRTTISVWSVDTGHHSVLGILSL